MVNPIDAVFRKNNHLKIMTHVVAGYPDLETSKEIVIIMAQSGADMVEIQIPFSDPLADGPTITLANQKALENGTTVEKCFRMASELTQIVDIPLLFMSYTNIPFRMGSENFIEKSAKSGISGLIIPDLPFDEENDGYLNIMNEHGLYPIQVVSPDVREQRLAQVLSHSRGFVYTTLKVGITGATNNIHADGLSYIDIIRKHTTLPIAAGFGISSPERIKQVAGKADAAVIGSHLINLFNEKGIDSVADFIRSSKEAIDN